jgi:hypothetical protein
VRTACDRVFRQRPDGGDGEGDGEVLVEEHEAPALELDEDVVHRLERQVRRQPIADAGCGGRPVTTGEIDVGE